MGNLCPKDDKEIIKWDDQSQELIEFYKQKGVSKFFLDLIRKTTGEDAIYIRTLNQSTLGNQTEKSLSSHLSKITYYHENSLRDINYPTYQKIACELISNIHSSRDMKLQIAISMDLMIRAIKVSNQYQEREHIILQAEKHLFNQIKKSKSKQEEGLGFFIPNVLLENERSLQLSGIYPYDAFLQLKLRGDSVIQEFLHDKQVDEEIRTQMNNYFYAIKFIFDFYPTPFKLDNEEELLEKQKLEYEYLKIFRKYKVPHFTPSVQKYQAGKRVCQYQDFVANLQGYLKSTQSPLQGEVHYVFAKLILHLKQKERILKKKKFFTYRPSPENSIIFVSQFETIMQARRIEMIAAGILNGEVPMEQVLFDILTDLQERPNVFTESISFVKEFTMNWLPRFDDNRTVFRFLIHFLRNQVHQYYHPHVQDSKISLMLSQIICEFLIFTGDMSLDKAQNVSDYLQDLNNAPIPILKHAEFIKLSQMAHLKNPPDITGDSRFEVYKAYFVSKEERAAMLHQLRIIQQYEIATYFPYDQIHSFRQLKTFILNEADEYTFFAQDDRELIYL